MNLALLCNSSDDPKQPVVELVQELIDGLFALPPADGNFRQIVKLPENTYVFPRHKPIPIKTTTVWEEFAKSKGIQKRKRDRMVFDEATEEVRMYYYYFFFFKFTFIKSINHDLEKTELWPIKCLLLCH